MTAGDIKDMTLTTANTYDASKTIIVVKTCKWVVPESITMNGSSTRTVTVRFDCLITTNQATASFYVIKLA